MICTLKELIDKYGLPLDVVKDNWYNGYYFHAERIDSFGTVYGSTYTRGRYYKMKSYKSSEIMQLRFSDEEELDEEEPDEEEPDDIYLIEKKNIKLEDNTSQNPNNLDINKNNYIKDVTKVYINRNGSFVPAVFDRFESKNGKDVIYVTHYGETKSSFYTFPQSKYVFPDINGAARAAKEAREMSKITIDISPVDSIVAAYNKKPIALKPLREKSDEYNIEKKYHSIVHNMLNDELDAFRKQIEEAKGEIKKAKDDLMEARISAREDKVMLDDYTFISHDITVNRAQRTIDFADEKAYTVMKTINEPYFARIDCGRDMNTLHTAYLGNRDISGYVVDWRRADIGNIYYNSDFFKSRDGICLALKRTFKISNGIFERFDDDINMYYQTDGQLFENQIDDIDYSKNTDAMLIKLLKESRLDKNTHDIIKTIQSEQYNIITSDFEKNAVVNGCAGSGKTMIMYHRLSYMAYNFKLVLNREFDAKKVFIVSPSVIFDLNNNELMRKLSIDKVNYGPFYEHIDNIIRKYCSNNKLIDFHTLSRIIDVYGTTKYNYYDESSFKVYEENIAKIDEKEYKDWVRNIANKYIKAAGLKEIQMDVEIENNSDIIRLFYSHNYYLNDCFARHEGKDNNEYSETGYYNKSAITSISFENVASALNTLRMSNNTIQRRKRISRYENILKCCLGTQTKTSEQGIVVTNISDFWNLIDKPSILEKMMNLIIAEKLLTCTVVTGSDDLLKCIFVYQKYYSKDYSTSIWLYILKYLVNKFGPIDKSKTIVFVDEFQNYAPFELQCLKDAMPMATFNLFGDYAQQIEEKGSDLRENLTVLMQPNIFEINVNYRNAKQITEYINQNTNKDMKSIGVDGQVVEEKLNTCKFEIINRTAIICKNKELTKYCLKDIIDKEQINDVSKTGEIIAEKYTFISVLESKGLEFDTVYVFDNGMNENEKYVSYTRALDRLVVISDNLEEIKGQYQKKEINSNSSKIANQDIVKNTIKIRRKLKDEYIMGREQVDTPREKENECKVTLNEEGYNVVQDDLQRREDSLDTTKDENKTYNNGGIKEQENYIINNGIQEKFEKIYTFATSKLNVSDISQMNDAIIILEILGDYKDAKNNIIRLRQRIGRINKEEKDKIIGYRAKRLCQHCGGNFTGIFIKRCQHCGREKDY